MKYPAPETLCAKGEFQVQLLISGIRIDRMIE